MLGLVGTCHMGGWQCRKEGERRFLAGCTGFVAALAAVGVPAGLGDRVYSADVSTTPNGKHRSTTGAATITLNLLQEMWQQSDLCFCLCDAPPSHTIYHHYVP